MPLPEREYFDLSALAKRWQTTVQDVQHYAETGKLRCSVWLDQISVETGVFKKRANGQKLFEPLEKLYIEGFVGIRPEDCRRLFRNERASTTVFVSLKQENLYLHITRETEAKIAIEPKDLVVRAIDRDHFERINGLGTGVSSILVNGFCENGGVFERSKKFSHSADFTTVTISGEIFRFGMIQAKIVSLLYGAYTRGDPWVHGKTLLYNAGSQSERIKSIFQSKPSWRKLIKSDGRGYYALDL